MYQYRTSLYITPIEYREIHKWLCRQFIDFGENSVIDAAILNENAYLEVEFTFIREQDLAFFLMQWSDKYN